MAEVIEMSTQHMLSPGHLSSGVPRSPQHEELIAIAREMVRLGLPPGESVRRRLGALVQEDADEDVCHLAKLVLELATELSARTESLRATVANKARIESEMNAAQEIQRGLLPKLLPKCPNRDEFALHALIQPALGVGGDLYDYFWVDPHRFFFMIGDVSEKGVPAALLMAVTSTLIKNHVPSNASLCDAIAKVNDALAESNEALMFVTMFCGLLDVRTGELEYCDGGHNAPCLVPREAPVTMLEKKTGIALGFEPGFRFQSGKITLRAGDCIFLYTDGITEAMNSQRNLYTEERLQTTLDRLRDLKLPDLVGGVMDDVRLFAAGAPQSDDIAMLVIRYQGPDEPFDA